MQVFWIAEFWTAYDVVEHGCPGARLLRFLWLPIFCCAGPCRSPFLSCKQVCVFVQSSSSCETPDELKAMIDEAPWLGMVVMDIYS